jgi:MYXO-CTERM domain-containing protein
MAKRRDMGGFSRRVLLLVFVAVPAGAGCGDVHGIPIDQTARDIAATVCPKAYECCTPEQLMGNDSAGTTQAECEDRTAQDFRSHLQGIQRSVDQGRARYESAKVDACLQTIETSACGALNMTNHLTGVPGCDSFVTPLVPPGSECGNDFECIDGWCDFPEDPDPPGPGVCRMHVSGNLSCLDHAECGPGRICHPDSHTCHALKDPGAACTSAVECKSGLCGGDPAQGPASVCLPNEAPRCFYQSGCSAAGDGAPSGGTILLLVAFSAIALVRARRRADR